MHHALQHAAHATAAPPPLPPPHDPSNTQDLSLRTDQRRWARPHHGRHEHVSLVPTPSPSHRTHLVGAAARAMGTLQLPSPARFLPLRRNAVAAAGDSLAENPAVSEHSGVYTAHTPRDQSEQGGAEQGGAEQGRVLWQATVETSSRSCHAIAYSAYYASMHRTHPPSPCTTAELEAPELRASR